MKYLMPLLLLLTPVVSPAQINYINYHRQIIQAENYMLALDYKACINAYQETFQAYPKTFARDAFVALQIACVIKDTANVVYFFELCVSNGLEWETLKVSKNFRDMCTYDLKLKGRLDEGYNKARKKYELSIDLTLRNLVLGMLKKDDSIRKYADHDGADSIMVVKWLLLMEHNVYQLDSVTKKRGYPGEHKIGALIKNVTVTAGHPTGVYLCSLPARVLFHNQCGFQLMKVELLEAVQQGELTPREYALIQEWSFNFFDRSKRWWDKHYCAPCTAGPRDKRYNFFLNDRQYISDIKFVDQCRNEVGMCSVFHEKKLKSFADEHGLILRFGIFGSF